MSKPPPPGPSAPARRTKTPRRERYPNLSPTRPPTVEADAALWPDWTEISVEDLDLDAFDDEGFPLSGQGGGN